MVDVKNINDFLTLIIITIPGIFLVTLSTGLRHSLLEYAELFIFLTFVLTILTTCLFAIRSFSSIRARPFNKLDIPDILASILFGLILSLAYTSLITVLIEVFTGVEKEYLTTLILLCTTFLLVYPLFEFFSLSKRGKEAILTGQSFIETLVEKTTLVLFNNRILGSIGLYFAIIIFPILFLSLFEEFIVATILWALVLPMIYLGVLAGLKGSEDLLIWRLVRKIKLKDYLNLGIASFDFRKETRILKLLPSITVGGLVLLIFGFQILISTSFEIVTEMRVILSGLTLIEEVSLFLIFQTLINKGRGATKETLDIWDRQKLKGSASAVLFPAFLGVALFTNLTLGIVVTSPHLLQGFVSSTGIIDHIDFLRIVLIFEDVIIVSLMIYGFFFPTNDMLSNLIHRTVNYARKGNYQPLICLSYLFDNARITKQRKISVKTKLKIVRSISTILKGQHQQIPPYIEDILVHFILTDDQYLRGETYSIIIVLLDKGLLVPDKFIDFFYNEIDSREGFATEEAFLGIETCLRLNKDLLTNNKLNSYLSDLVSEDFTVRQHSLRVWKIVSKISPKMLGKNKYIDILVEGMADKDMGKRMHISEAWNIILERHKELITPNVLSRLLNALETKDWTIKKDLLTLWDKILNITSESISTDIIDELFQAISTDDEEKQSTYLNLALKIFKHNKENIPLEIIETLILQVRSDDPEYAELILTNVEEILQLSKPELFQKLVAVLANGLKSNQIIVQKMAIQALGSIYINWNDKISAFLSYDDIVKVLGQAIQSREPRIRKTTLETIIKIIDTRTSVNTDLVPILFQGIIDTDYNIVNFTVKSIEDRINSLGSFISSSILQEIAKALETQDYLTRHLIMQLITQIIGQIPTDTHRDVFKIIELGIRDSNSDVNSFALETFLAFIDEQPSFITTETVDIICDQLTNTDMITRTMALKCWKSIVEKSPFNITRDHIKRILNNVQLHTNEIDEILVKAMKSVLTNNKLVRKLYKSHQEALAELVHYFPSIGSNSQAVIVDTLEIIIEESIDKKAVEWIKKQLNSLIKSCKHDGLSERLSNMSHK